MIRICVLAGQTDLAWLRDTVAELSIRRGWPDCELDGASLVYEQLYAGKTGEANHESHYAGMLAYSRAHSDALCFAGFGISTRKKVEEVISAGFDGAVIGTELIRRLNTSLEEFGDFIENVHRAVETA